MNREMQSGVQAAYCASHRYHIACKFQNEGLTMRNGKCPKCGSATVYAKTNGLGFGDSDGVLVYVGLLTRQSPAVAFVCITCGYFENYIADPGKLAEVAKTWQKVATAIQ